MLDCYLENYLGRHSIAGQATYLVRREFFETFSQSGSFIAPRYAPTIAGSSHLPNAGLN